MSKIYIPEPLEHQTPVFEDDHRFKVLRCGRRWGKSRFSLIAAVVGHGPKDESGMPKFKGIAQGVSGIWLVRDFPQARAIWREEIEPRFAALNGKGVQLHQQERRLTIDGYGTLEIRSNENIDSVRGSRLGFVIPDEGAHFDLEYAWKDVLLPALLDLGGWAIFPSTPNAGPDGHEDEGGKRSPSYFNLLCERIVAGDMGPQWAHFHSPTHANKIITPAALEALINEYPPESPQLKQEIYAELVAAGTGVAFPEWATDVHVARYEPRVDSRWTASGDWGWHKGALHLFASANDRTLCRHEYVFKEKTPYEVGYNFALQCLRYKALPEWVSIDTPAVADGGPSILDELQRGSNDALRPLVPEDFYLPVWINPPKGPGSRITKKTQVHKLLRFTRLPDGTVPVGHAPRLQFHPDCTYIIASLPKLPRDPKGSDDVDTKADDHGYDSIAAWAMTNMTPAADPSVSRVTDPDSHPGWDWKEGKEKQAHNPWSEMIETAAESGPRWSRNVEVR